MFPQGRLEPLAEGSSGIGAGEAVIEEDAGVLRRDQQVLFGRQAHGVEHPLDRAWPGQVGVRLHHARHQGRAAAPNCHRAVARQAFVAAGHRIDGFASD
jgi:hypothetical protein